MDSADAANEYDNYAPVKNKVNKSSWFIPQNCT